MAGQIFKKIFGKDSHSFNSTSEVDRFIERKTGHKIRVARVHTGVSSNRGSVFSIKHINASDQFDKAVK